MYTAGRPHPLKEPCIEVLSLAAMRPRAFFTDAEVLQELLHRYLAVQRWPEGRGVFDRFAWLMRGRVEAVCSEDVRAAASLADQHLSLAARDLLHAAVMARVGADRIISADQGFDHLPHLTRLDPADVSSWRALVEAS